MKQGIDSKLLVGIIKTDSDRVAVVPSRTRVDNLVRRVTWRIGFNYVDQISSFDIPKHKW